MVRKGLRAFRFQGCPCNCKRRARCTCPGSFRGRHWTTGGHRPDGPGKAVHRRPDPRARRPAGAWSLLPWPRGWPGHGVSRASDAQLRPEPHRCEAAGFSCACLPFRAEPSPAPCPHRMGPAGDGRPGRPSHEAPNGDCHGGSSAPANWASPQQGGHIRALRPAGPKPRAKAPAPPSRAPGGRRFFGRPPPHAGPENAPASGRHTSAGGFSAGRVAPPSGAPPAHRPGCRTPSTPAAG